MIARKKDERLTATQQGILNFISGTIRAHHRAPSLREIADAFDIGTASGVVCHLKALEAKGYIKRDSKARSIKVLRLAVLPLVGRVSAGKPIEMFEFHEDWSFEDLFGDLDELTCMPLHGDLLLQYHLAEGDRIILRDCKPVGMLRLLESGGN